VVPIPASAKVARNKASEAMLGTKARAWIEGDERTPGLHASDLTEPLMAFWQRVSPKALPDKLVNMFLVGKVLHAFVLGAVDGSAVDITTTDSGSRSSDSLGITYSPDAVIDGVVRELKTSRALYEARDLRDIDTYLEQLLVYMVATNTTYSQLWILYINLKDENGRTTPSFRAYDFTISEEDLAATKAYLVATKERLEKAIESRDPSGLPLCKEFKCGATNCQWYAECRPAGRWGDPKWDGTAGHPQWHAEGTSPQGCGPAGGSEQVW
jgi:hypothetical protein